MYFESRKSWDEVNLYFLFAFMVFGIISVWNIYFFVLMTVFSIIWMIAFIYKNVDNRSANKTISWYGWNNPRKFFFFYGTIFYLWIFIAAYYAPFGWVAAPITTTVFHHIFVLIWIGNKDKVRKTCLREKEVMIKTRYLDPERNYAGPLFWFGDFYTHPYINRLKSNVKKLQIFLSESRKDK